MATGRIDSVSTLTAGVSTRGMRTDPANTLWMLDRGAQTQAYMMVDQAWSLLNDSPLLIAGQSRGQWLDSLDNTPDAAVGGALHAGLAPLGVQTRQEAKPELVSK